MSISICNAPPVIHLHSVSKTSGPEVALFRGMTTQFTSLKSTSARSPDVALFRQVSLPSIGTREQKVDQVLADSFPASDPPSWTLGRAAATPSQLPNIPSEGDEAWSSHTTVIVDGGRRTPWQWIATAVGAIAVGMLIPIAILAIGIPVALATQAAIEVVTALSARVFG
jgi:hypothetical protein